MPPVTCNTTFKACTDIKPGIFKTQKRCFFKIKMRAKVPKIQTTVVFEASSFRVSRKPSEVELYSQMLTEVIREIFKLVSNFNSIRPRGK